MRRLTRLRKAVRARMTRARPSRIVLVCLLVLILVSGLAVTGASAYHGYQLYRRGLAITQDGLDRLRAGETSLKSLETNPLNATAVTTALADFSQAGYDFDQVQTMLGQVPAAAGAVPNYGAKFTAALHLLPIARDAARVGIVGCDALVLVSSRLRDPLTATSQGITRSDLSVLSSDLDQARQLLADLSLRVNALSAADMRIDPRIAPALAEFRSSAPALGDYLATAQTLLQVAPGVLGIGKPTDYLVEQLDSTELRPGGGFVGTYGVLALSGARLTTSWPVPMTDVDLLDKPFEFAGGSIPYPPQYTWFPLASSWSLRDSNLDADFPTGAVWAERLYREEGGTLPVQGVIAITPWLIQGALQITGPIYVPEYGETVNAANLIDRIHYHQLLDAEGADYIPSADGHSSLRKRFTSYLFEHFLARVRQVAPARMADFVRLALSALSSKDIQLYVNSAPAESLLRRYHRASAIEAPAGDSFLSVDANIIADKANNFITYTLRDQITLDRTGTAHHQTTLTYTWPRGAESEEYAYGTYYRDYARVYVPPASRLRAQQGWDPQRSSRAFGRAVWAGILTVGYGSSTTITLTWDEPGAARLGAAGWQYHYLVQKQPGLTWHIDLRVRVTGCAATVGTATGWSARRDGTYTAGGPLSQDRNLELDYRC